jgi:hypothetical protein
MLLSLNLEVGGWIRRGWAAGGLTPYRVDVRIPDDSIIRN